MDEKLQKKLLRQLRAIRFWLGFLVVIMAVGFGVLGFLVFQAMDVVKDARTQLDTLQSQAETTTELKDKLCGSGLAANTTLCSDNN